MSESSQLAELLRREIHGQIGLFNSLWERYGRDLDSFAPHRQRTAVNRLTGYALFLGLGQDKTSRAGRALETLRDWRTRVGRIRDLDITREWIALSRGSAPPEAGMAADAVDAEVLEERRETLASVRLDIQGLPGAETRVALHILTRLFDEVVAAMEEAGPDHDHWRALRVVWRPWDAALSVLGDSMHDEQLHRFRIRNKRLRFVIDVLAEAGKGTGEGRLLAKRARILAKLHTTLGNLSDLVVLRDRLRVTRARWVLEKRGWDESAEALERGRAALELREFSDWLRLWPIIRDDDFIRNMLPGEARQPRAPQNDLRRRRAAEPIRKRARKK